MKFTGKDALKVLTGMVLSETLGHYWMGIWGREYLPMQIGGLTFTESMNRYAMIGWPIVLFTLIYLAWHRKPSVSTGEGSGRVAVTR